MSHALGRRSRSIRSRRRFAGEQSFENLETRQCLAGLVAAFGFEEGSGLVAGDSSGNNHVGSLTGASWTASGRFGGALSFDGVNDWVTIADSTMLDLSNAMTLEAWARPTGISGWETVLLKEGTNDLAYCLYADNNGNDTGGPRRPGAWIRQGSTSYSTLGTSQLALNTWTHLAGTYDGTTLRFFVNGVEVSSAARTGPINATANPLRIGGNAIWSEWFQGQIDEVRIYDIALTQAAIAADMNSPVTPLVDVIAPTVVATNPATGATGVAVTSRITVTFSEPMDAATVGTATVVLLDAVGAPVASTVNYDAATRVATLTPLAALSPVAAYTLLLRGGAGSPRCSDLAGNPLASDVIASFTTAALDGGGVLLGTEGYGYAAFTHTYEALDLTPGAAGVITIRSTGNNNASLVTLPAGNAFNFYGTSYSSLYVSTNGLITFGSSNTSASNTNLTSLPNQRAIAPLWDDWVNTSLNAILLAKYEDVTGDGVNDRLVLEWNRVQGSPSSPSQVTFQTILQLNTGAQGGRITFNYVDLDSGDARSNGASATVGIKDSGPQGARRLPLSFNASTVHVGSGKAIRIVPDATAPTVSVTAPADGAILSGAVTVTADAADDVGVVGVQFLLDGNPLGPEDLSAPYSAAWDTAATASGAHTLSVRARDAQGNTTTSLVRNVSVVPRLVINAPVEGATISGTTVNVSYSTSGDLAGAAVHHVHFSLDGGADVMDINFDGALPLTNVPPGPHVLRGYLVRADHGKIIGTDSLAVAFTVLAGDTTPPAVTITSPTEGANVTGTTVLAASASDDIGVVGVQFFVDGVVLGSELTAAPYVMSWNTTAVAAGTHTVTARARDAAGNTTLSVAVTTNVVFNPNDPALIGQWTDPIDLPLVAINSVLLNDGRVLMWDGGPECIGSTTARVWNPATGATTPVPLPYFTHQDDDIFCSAQVVLPDGRVLVVGGHDCDGPQLGIAMTNIFDPRTMTWTRGPDMAFRRWYPTATLLANGKVLVTGGSVNTTVDYVPIPEVYDPVTNTWTRLNAASEVIPNYAFVFQAPDGRVLVAGSDEAKMATKILDVGTQTWSVVDPTILDAGSAVMYLPGKVMKTGSSYLSPPADNGGGIPSAATTYVLDLSAPTPAWQQTASMDNARTHLNLTILADGTVLATGGSTDIGGVNPANSVYEAELWNPATRTWTTLDSAQVPRLYHSTALLLPDGRVLSAGGGHNFFNNIAYPNAEIFSPPYLFKGARPTISSTPGVLSYGGSFFVSTPNAADIAAVALVRNGSVTHSFDMDQRYVPLTFSQTAGGLTVVAPANANTAPPGYYMLFIVNRDGVPSIAPIVHLPVAVADTQAPTAPVGVIASAAGSTIALNWSPSSDNVGVTKYNVHRSTAPNFVPSGGNRVGQPVNSTFVDSGLAPGTYYFKVTAEDASGNISQPSSEAIATAAVSTIQLVQHGGKGFEFSTPNISLAYASNNTVGNLLIVTGTAARPSGTITISDTAGNTYLPALGPVADPAQEVNAYIWYVASAVGGPNTVTLTPSGFGHAMEIHISEWSGADKVSPLDQTSFATGRGPVASSGTVTPTQPGELIFAYAFVDNDATAGPGFTPLTLINGDLDEYQIQGEITSVAATFTQETEDWLAMVATFKSNFSDSQAPTAPGAISAIGSVGAVTVNWSAATDNVGVTQYRVYRSSIAGFTPSPANQIGTSTTTAYTDYVAAGTYYYRVTAHDAAGNAGPPSNQAAAVATADTAVPTVIVTSPSAGSLLSGVATVSANATDNVGVVGVQFLLDGINLGAEDNTAPYSFSWNTTAVSNGAHVLTARARDAAGNTAAAAEVSVIVANSAPTGLVLALGFEETTGLTASDASGSGNNGSVSGATWSAAGRFGGALSFDGANDLVTIADTASLDLTTGMTLEAWVNPTAVNADYRTIMLKERANGLAYALYATDGAGRPPAGYVHVTGDRFAVGTSTLPLATWTHLASTFDGSNLRMYVNGTLVRTTAVTGGISVSTGALRIGGNNVWGEYFSGLIDEVRVYNRALSAAEIQTDMGAAIGGGGVGGPPVSALSLTQIAAVPSDEASLSAPASFGVPALLAGSEVESASPPTVPTARLHALQAASDEEGLNSLANKPDAAASHFSVADGSLARWRKSVDAVYYWFESETFSGWKWSGRWFF